ncbi:MAG: hypothetical protein CVU46_11070 [Chloroflexi bacterium HGW-Chloroflexi-8]|jgi:HK97 gp10 family phage protein|nr:MAG: hypothetical protein CVU46_11070 [Chloroflexi bacterium HGW-Chloroflexi-8]
MSQWRVTITDNRIPELIQRLPVETDNIVQKIANDILAYVVNSMAGAKHGRLYQRGKIVHQASAPSEPPAIDTGHLANSIQAQKVKVGSARINVGAAYGVNLELGTSKMAARPFLKPAAEHAWPIFKTAIGELFKRLAR